MRNSTEPPRDAAHLSYGHFYGRRAEVHGRQMITGSEKSAAARATRHENLTFLQLLFRYLWPFWLFKDASRGDRNARAAAYHHNRNMRAYLPGYLLKWVVGQLARFRAHSGVRVARRRGGARPRRSGQPLCGHGRRRRHHVCGQPVRPVRDQLRLSVPGEARPLSFLRRRTPEDRLRLRRALEPDAAGEPRGRQATGSKPLPARPAYLPNVGLLNL